MSWRDELVQIMKSDFEARKKLNPSYSIRAYAQSLNLSSGPLSEILSGKRLWNFTPDWAQKVLQKIQIDPAVKRRLELQMGFTPVVATIDLDPNEAEQALFNDWRYFAIFVGFDLPPPRNTVKGLSDYFGIAEDKVATIANHLVTIGWLEQDASGLFLKVKKKITSSSVRANENIQAFHRTHLSMAAEALSEVSPSERDYQALTFVGSHQSFEKLKNEIKSLFANAAIIADEGASNSEVYRLGLQLFPMGKSPKQNKG